MARQMAPKADMTSGYFNITLLYLLVNYTLFKDLIVMCIFVLMMYVY